jgi:hypothetical protein
MNVLNGGFVALSHPSTQFTDLLHPDPTPVDVLLSRSS